MVGAAFGSVAQQLFEKQRIAASALDGGAHHRGIEPAHLPGKLVGVRAGQRGEIDQGEGQTGQSLAQAAVERIAVAARGQQQQHRLLGGDGGQPGDRRQGRLVGPVQILYRQQQRHATRQPRRQQRQHLTDGVGARDLVDGLPRGHGVGRQRLVEPGLQGGALQRRQIDSLRFAAAGELPQQLALRIALAAAAEIADLRHMHHEARGQRLLARLLQQPGLADTRLAAQQHGAAAAVARGGEAGAQQVKLGGAADQRPGGAGHSRGQFEQSPQMLRRLDAFQFVLAAILQPHGLRHRLAHLVGQQSLAAAGLRHDAGGEIDRIAQCRVLAMRLPAQAADDGLARRQPDMQADLVAALPTE